MDWDSGLCGLCGQKGDRRRQERGVATGDTYNAMHTHEARCRQPNEEDEAELEGASPAGSLSTVRSSGIPEESEEKRKRKREGEKKRTQAHTHGITEKSQHPPLICDFFSRETKK